MARFLNLTVAQFQGAVPPAEPLPTQRVLLNVDHVVSVSEGAPRMGYPDGFTMITTTSRTENGMSEVYYVAEKVDYISRGLPI